MRASGILMPVSSLPGPFGIGTLGSEATAFVDFLAEAKQTYWQILPIGPTGYGDSPYQSFSAEEIPAAQPVSTVDYGALYNQRPVLLKKAADRLLAAPSPAYEDFCAAQSFWLEDYALFMAVKAEQGQAGLADWPDALRCREPEVIAAAKVRLADQINYHKAVQFFFYTQWNALKAYANRKGVLLVGDIPIYVSPDSSDLWTHPELFQTDGQMHLTHVAGCPPDSFAADGQLWGNPLYDLPAHKATGFDWWKRRMKHATSIYDVVRIDHFRGFESYYSIPAENTTAAGGHWEKGPDRDFIHAMQQALGGGNIIAEDLGYLTPEVKAMLAESGYPGMKIMQFAFGLAQQRQRRGRSLRLPVSALHAGGVDRRHDLCLPCQRFGYCHHPAGRLAASGQRGPHQHPQHAGRKLALAAGAVPARCIGRAHRRADHAV